DVITNDYLANITVTWKTPGVDMTHTGNVKIPLADLLGSTHSGIQKANAIALYVDALLSAGGKGDGVALGKASAQIEAINTKYFEPEVGPPGDADLQEILGLLKRHPKYPAQP
ncbi:MAG TPA: hypothetical protein VK459_02740, partial [Polyangiaceae bacterium]|nr:hypothetical protein [Polyangiaceae bacterium]